MTQVSLSTEKPSLWKDVLTSPLATIVASVLTSFVIAAGGGSAVEPGSSEVKISAVLSWETL